MKPNYAPDMRLFSPKKLGVLQRMAFVDEYRYAIGRRIFDVAGRALDARTALALVNTQEDNAVVIVLHPQTADLEKLVELLESHPELSLYDPKVK